MIQHIFSDLFLVCLAEIFLTKASPEEVEKAKSKGRIRKTAAKAKSQKPLLEEPADPTPRQGKTNRPKPSEVETETPVKSPPKKKGKDGGDQDHDIAPRRLSFKKQDPQPERQIVSLQKDRPPCFSSSIGMAIH